jgi:hypothetical protein
MKMIISGRVVVTGSLLAMTMTLVAGCFGGGNGHSDNPYGYNSRSYNSRPYDGGYGNPYPYNGGYNDTHSFPQSFGNANSYSAGLQHGVSAKASRDGDHTRGSDQHAASAAIRPPDQARNERRPTSVDRDKDTTKD